MCLLLGLFVLASASSARAEGTGINLGGARLHPRLILEQHHVVNPGFASKSEDPTNDYYLAAGPGFDLDHETENSKLTMGGGVQYRRYFQNDRLSAVAGDLKASLEYNRERWFTLQVGNNLTRYADGGVDSVTSRLLHTVNIASIGVDVRPGGGALTFSTGYSLLYDRYDRTNNAVKPAKNLDMMRHQPEVQAIWKFLPKTAIFLQAQGDITRYPSAAPGVNIEVNVLRAYVGALGDVTSRLRALLKAGYANTFAEAGGEQTFAGQAEIAYALTGTITAKLGYMRSLQPTSLYGYFATNKGYLSYNQTLLAKTNLQLSAEYNHQTFGPPPSGATLLRRGRRDGDFAGSISIEHFFRDWVALGLLNRVNVRTSTQENFGYLYNDSFVRLTLNY